MRGTRCGLGAAWRVLVIALVAWLVAPAAVAQSDDPGPPGPYVLDVRGVTLGIPVASAFYPQLLTDAQIPARGFGIDAGGHIYLFRIGPARIGVGASMVYIRGTARTPPADDADDPSDEVEENGEETVGGESNVASTIRIVAPQISFNFGTADGWSYLSAGYGPGRVSARVQLDGDDMERRTGSLGTLNIGGGARWFLNARMAIGFDLRIYRMGSGSVGEGANANSTPRTTVFGASAGLSFR